MNGTGLLERPWSAFASALARPALDAAWRSAPQSALLLAAALAPIGLARFAAARLEASPAADEFVWLGAAALAGLAARVWELFAYLALLLQLAARSEGRALAPA